MNISNALPVGAQLGAHIVALEVAYAWLFRRVASESFSPDQMRHDFIEEIAAFAERLVDRAASKPPAELTAVLQLANALRGLCEDVVRSR